MFLILTFSRVETLSKHVFCLYCRYIDSPQTKYSPSQEKGFLLINN